MVSNTDRASLRVASKYIFILRIGVTAGFVALAIAFGTLSYVVGASFEHRSAVERFRSIARYGVDTIRNDFLEKENVILGMAKNMAYFKSNETEWPNVVIPGFYDSVTALRDSANLEDIFFMPIVQPDEVPAFETFMDEYCASEPAIGAGPGIPGLGVFGVGPTGVFHDSTGEAVDYFSPKRMIVPLAQELFTQYIDKSSLLLNMHSLREFGPALDSIVDCSTQHNYTMAAKECVDISKLVNFPLFSTGSAVEQFRTAFLQPIYLNQNTSNLVGFIGGGFSWTAVLSKVLSDSISGVEVVVKTTDQTLTFKKIHSQIKFMGFGDFHDTKHGRYEHSVRFFAALDGGEDHSTYTVLFYPSDEFYDYYYTNNPIYAAVASFIALSVCAAIFFLYDYYVRGESAAHEAVLETKRRFVRFISHEIRTPLNAVHLGLEALVAEIRRAIELLPKPPLSVDPTTCNSLEMLAIALNSWLELSTEMTSNCDSAEDVLNDLLNYDKIEMGTLHLEFSSVVISDLVQVNTAVFHTQVKQKNIQFSMENHLAASHSGDVESQDTSLFVVVGDAARLAQVMRNLISNALKFTPNEGSISVCVERVDDGLPFPALEVLLESQELLQQPRAGSVRISVTDSGAGLSEEQLAKICSEGVQFNANELQAGKGSGLGLFITKGIVEQHGGKLTVTSAGIGAGATFTMELPLFRHVRKYTLSRSYSQRHVFPEIGADDLLSRSDITVLAGAQVDTTLGELKTRGTSLPKRILVVDDAPSNRKMLIRILTSNGYVCEQAEDGQQAIDKYRASLESGNFFNSIIMDFEMPVMNGPTATKKLRAMGCRVPVLGVTGNLLPEDIKHFKEHGANQVFGKPLNLTRFEEFMRECVILSDIEGLPSTSSSGWAENSDIISGDDLV